MDTPSAPKSRSLAKRLIFASIPLLLVLLALELGVRWLELDQECPNSYSEGGSWACDPILNFKLRPDLIVDGKPLNRAGFRSREFTPKAPGVFRVLSLGDSCTFGTLTTSRGPGYIREPYPQRLERLVAERIGPGQLEVLNAGIPGYNSFQGLMLLRTKLRGLEPDLITVRFGWNDHFMSVTDSSGYREPDSALALGVQDLMLRTSLYGFFRRLNFELQALRSSANPPPRPTLPTEWIPIIPLENYKHILRRIVALGRSQGAEVWLLTSSHAFVVDGNRGQQDKFPKEVLGFNAIPSFDRLIEIHDSYNQATREVGAELRAPVIDMDAVYRAHAAEPLFLLTDVPHPTGRGMHSRPRRCTRVCWSRGSCARVQRSLADEETARLARCRRGCSAAAPALCPRASSSRSGAAARCPRAGVGPHEPRASRPGAARGTH